MPKVLLALMVLIASVSGCGVVSAKAGDVAGKGVSRLDKLTGGHLDDDPGTSAEKDALTTAISNLHGPSIDFGYTLTQLDLDVQVMTGTYYDDPERWAATTRFTSFVAGSRQTSTMESTWARGRYFVQRDFWRGPAKGCWLLVGWDFMPYGGLAERPDQPVAISILDDLRPAPDAPQTRSGLTTARLPLWTALDLLPPWLIQRLGLEHLSDGKDVSVNVVAEVADSRLVGVKVPMSSLVSALEEVGRASYRKERLLSKLRIEVSYPVDAVSHAVAPPEPDLVMSADDLDSGRGCRERRSA